MFTVISAMVIAVSSLTACGSVDIESMTVDEIVDFAEGYGIDVFYSCNCGFQTTDDNAIADHSIQHALKGKLTNYGMQSIYEQQQVKVGSHEEDHGHYENTTYVDYYYCDCGSTKN